MAETQVYAFFISDLGCEEGSNLKGTRYMLLSSEKEIQVLQFFGFYVTGDFWWLLCPFMRLNLAVSKFLN